MAMSASRRRGHQILYFCVAILSLMLLNRGRRVWNLTPANAYDLKLDLRTAHPEVLMALPQIGPARMKAIRDEGRDLPFQSIGDLERRVKGIGPAISMEIAPYLEFESDSPSRP